jgi:hypothetical protein
MKKFPVIRKENAQMSYAQRTLKYRGDTPPGGWGRFEALESRLILQQL